MTVYITCSFVLNLFWVILHFIPYFMIVVMTGIVIMPEISDMTVKWQWLIVVRHSYITRLLHSWDVYDMMISVLWCKVQVKSYPRHPNMHEHVLLIGRLLHTARSKIENLGNVKLEINRMFSECFQNFEQELFNILKIQYSALCDINILTCLLLYAKDQISDNTPMDWI